MGYSTVIENMIADKLLDMNTAYIGKVLKYSNGKADIQPLGLVKQYGKSAQKQAIVKDVPVVQSARCKMKPKTLQYVSGISYHSPVYSSVDIVEVESLSAGDLVFCVCADRDITEAKNGNNATPQIGHHSMSDSVVVGVL